MKVGEKIWLVAAALAVVGANLVANSTPLVTVGSLIGIIYVVLVATRHVLANVFGIILACIFGYLSYSVGYLANAAVNLLLIAPMSLYGVFYWKKNSDAPPQELTSTQACVMTFLGMVASAITFYFTSAHGGNLPLLDAITGVLPVAATMLLVGRFKEQWYLWIPYNAIEVFMWFTAMSLAPEMLAIFVMRCVFFVNSLYGAYNWHKN